MENRERLEKLRFDVLEALKPILSEFTEDVGLIPTITVEPQTMEGRGKNYLFGFNCEITLR